MTGVETATITAAQYAAEGEIEEAMTNDRPKSGQYHVKLDIKGNDKAEKAFNALLNYIDPSYPIEDKVYCTKCGGLHWKDPMLSPHDIKMLAKQIRPKLSGLHKVKVAHFGPAADCGSHTGGGSHPTPVSTQKVDGQVGEVVV